MNLAWSWILPNNILLDIGYMLLKVNRSSVNYQRRLSQKCWQCPFKLYALAWKLPYLAIWLTLKYSKSSLKIWRKPTAKRTWISLTKWCWTILSKFSASSSSKKKASPTTTSPTRSSSTKHSEKGSCPSTSSQGNPSATPSHSSSSNQ